MLMLLMFPEDMPCIHTVPSPAGLGCSMTVPLAGELAQLVKPYASTQMLKVDASPSAYVLMFHAPKGGVSGDGGGVKGSGRVGGNGGGDGDAGGGRRGGGVCGGGDGGGGSGGNGGGGVRGGARGAVFCCS